MPQFPVPFRTSKQVPQYRPHKATSSSTKYALPPGQFHQRILEAVYTFPPEDISNELQHIQTHIHLTSARIRHLQELIDLEGAAIPWVKDLNQQLKSTYRDLRRFYKEVEQELGNNKAEPAEGAKKAVWQAYRRLARLEEGLIGLEENEDYMMSGALPAEETETYVSVSAEDCQCITQETPQDVVREVTCSIINMLRALPQLMAYGAPSQNSSSTPPPSSPPTGASLPAPEIITNPEQMPQPRAEVIARLISEESNGSLSLREPDRVRIGSCNGFTISQVIMSGREDDALVLPCLHHIKHHELRSLKAWLIQGSYITKSGVISRIEKLLHCLQMLKSGNRYESIAVLFSRSPRQVRDACLEVVIGLVALYDETVDEECEMDVYRELWGIWRRFDVNAAQGRAERYYGFRWTDVAKALVALNLYIARWRGSANGFEGRAFRWGRYLGVEEDGAVMGAIRRLGELHILQDSSSEESVADEASSLKSSPYEEPVSQALPSPYLGP